MKRRDFLFAGMALALAGGAAPALAAVAPAVPRGFAPTRFSVVVTGSGPDVILIPGLTASRDIWKGTVAAMPGYRYHLVQIAGFAGLPAGGNARGDIVAPVAAELARYISARSLRAPVLVGHSMGGTIAMMVAARQPRLVGKLMVVDMLPQPAGLLGSTTAGVRGFAGLMRDLGATPGGRQLVESLIGMFGNEQAAGSRSDPDVVARATHELALTDLTPELPRIQAPLTVVYASLDPGRRAAIDRLYAGAYAGKKGARLIRVDNSGHMIMYEQPARFRQLLKNFLAA